MKTYDFRAVLDDASKFNADFWTATGKPVFFSDPYRTVIDPRDLYIHLTHQSRYAGAIQVPILLHLAICVKIAKALKYDPRLVALCAAHDLHEAYCQDLTSGLKRQVPGYDILEDEWMTRVHDAIGLPLPDMEEGAEEGAKVKLVDTLALWIETFSMGFPAHFAINSWCEVPESLQVKLQSIWKMMPNHPEHWMIVVTEALNAGGANIPVMSRYPRLHPLCESDT